MAKAESKDESGRGDVDVSEVLIDPARITKYRQAAARLNYMALDDPRISYASKEISRGMANPTIEGEMRIKRAVRYLRGQPCCVW